MVQYDDLEKANKQVERVMNLERAMRQQEEAIKRQWWEVAQVFADLAVRIAAKIESSR